MLLKAFKADFHCHLPHSFLQNTSFLGSEIGPTDSLWRSMYVGFPLGVRSLLREDHNRK